jgi:beta-phosphoglucomutase-like phosphatase (HAD superfamily)
VIVTADQVARAKPSPDIYFEAARRLGVPPSQCLALEDSEAGIIAASRAGMTTMLIPDLAVPSRVAFDTASYVRSSLYEARRLIAVLLSQQVP